MCFILICVGCIEQFLAKINLFYSCVSIYMSIYIKISLFFYLQASNRPIFNLNGKFVHAKRLKEFSWKKFVFLWLNFQFTNFLMDFRLPYILKMVLSKENCLFGLHLNMYEWKMKGKLYFFEEKRQISCWYIFQYICIQIMFALV